MSLVTLEEVLKNTIKEKYAVGAFNIANHTLTEGVLSAAEKRGLPIILNLAEAHLEIIYLDNFIPYLLDRIERSPVPVVLHLDQGVSYHRIIEAIEKGSSSVMFDGSSLPIEENITRTKEIVEIAHAQGVSVEAELGRVGGLKEGTNYGQVKENIFTDPDIAIEFVKQTQIDALAVSIGTVHGVYRGAPCLNYELLKKLRKQIKIPLVLHGGSGLSEADFKRLVTCGINKINFFTGMSLAAVEALKKELVKNPDIGFPEINLVAQNKIEEIVLKQLEVFNTRPL